MTPGPLDGKHGLPHPPLQKGGEGCKVKSRSSPDHLHLGQGSGDPHAATPSGHVAQLHEGSFPHRSNG
jgi:hypothetical protein